MLQINYAKVICSVYNDMEYSPKEQFPYGFIKGAKVCDADLYT